MPHLTFPVVVDRTLPVPVIVAASASTIKAQRAANQPVATPIQAAGLVDTGSNFSAVSLQLLQRLGITPHGFQAQTTAGSQGKADMYWVSLSSIGPAGAAGPMFAVPDVEVSALLVPLDVEVLVGMDVLLGCQFHIDGPARQFTFTF
jgi:hypothetical protein